jgi:hypothetical protein
MTRVLRTGAQVVIGEIGYWSLWAARRRFRACASSCLGRRRVSHRSRSALTQVAEAKSNQDVPRNLLSPSRPCTTANIAASFPFNKTGIVEG